MENCKLSSGLIMQTSYITNNSQGIPVLVDGAIDLYSGAYSVLSEGIYEVITGYNDFSNNIRLNDVLYNASLANGQTVIIINKDPVNPVYTDLLDYPTLDSGVVYKFVSDGGQWRKVPTPGAMYANGATSGNVTLTKAGVYVTLGDKPEVTLPNASEFDGQTIILFNPQLDYTCKVNGGIYYIDNTYYSLFTLDANSMLKLKSVGGNWRIVKYSYA